MQPELLGFWTLPIVRYSRNYKTQRFGNWMFPSSREGEGKTPTQLGPLERANLYHWTTPVRFTTAVDGNRSSFRNVLFSSF
jgi:hypothetical protein